MELLTGSIFASTIFASIPFKEKEAKEDVGGGREKRRGRWWKRG